MDNQTDEKTLNISMTKANKILIKLRHAPSQNKKPSRYGQTQEQYGFSTTMLNFNKEATEKKIDKIVQSYRKSLLKRQLLEKWRNRLFELNIKYGIHSILSELDLLNYEKNGITDILEESKTNNYNSLENVISGMDNVTNYEKRFELNWKIGCFDVEELNNRLVEINKQISSLDEKKDLINIQNTFSITLSEEELNFLEI